MLRTAITRKTPIARLYTVPVSGREVGLFERFNANFTAAFPLKEHDYYDQDGDVEFFILYSNQNLVGQIICLEKLSPI